MSFSAADDFPPTEQAPGDDRLDFLLEWSEAPSCQEPPAEGASREVAWVETSVLVEPTDAAAIPAEPEPRNEEPTHQQSASGASAASEEEACLRGSAIAGSYPASCCDIVTTPATPVTEENGAETDESPEFFEWTAERHRAIDEALGACAARPLPRVHCQLEEIRRALEGGHLAHEPALALLDEIDDYLARRVGELTRRVPVAHAAVIDSRADRERALDAYGQSVAALREYLATGDRIHLDLAIYTADQGSACVASARRVIMEAQPEAPAEVMEE